MRVKRVVMVGYGNGGGRVATKGEEVKVEKLVLNGGDD